MLLLRLDGDRASPSLEMPFEDLPQDMEVVQPEDERDWEGWVVC